MQGEQFIFTCSPTGGEVWCYHVGAIASGDGQGSSITDFVVTKKSSPLGSATISAIAAAKDRLLVLEKVEADKSKKGHTNWCEASALCLRFV